MMHQQLSRVCLTKRLSLIILKFKSKKNEKIYIFSLIEEKEKTIRVHELTSSLHSRQVFDRYILE